MAPLTVLLWVYAEQEKLERQNDIRVKVEVTASSPDRIVTLISPDDRELRLDLKAPSASVYAVRGIITDPRDGPLKIVVNEPPPYEGDVSVADRLARSELFSSRAVVVERAEPVLRVRVEARVRRDIPLVVRPDQKTIANIIEPKTVSVDGPESLFRQSGDQLVVWADVAQFADKPPGERMGTCRSASIRRRWRPGRAAGEPVCQSARGEAHSHRGSAIKGVRGDADQEHPAVRPHAGEQAGRRQVSDRDPASDTAQRESERTAGNAREIDGATADFSAAALLNLTLEDFKSDALGQKQSRTLKSEDYLMPPGVKVLNPDTIDFTIREKRDGMGGEETMGDADVGRCRCRRWARGDVLQWRHGPVERIR